MCEFITSEQYQLFFHYLVPMDDGHLDFLMPSSGVFVDRTISLNIGEIKIR